LLHRGTFARRRVPVHCLTCPRLPPLTVQCDDYTHLTFHLLPSRLLRLFIGNAIPTTRLCANFGDSLRATASLLAAICAVLKRKRRSSAPSLLTFPWRCRGRTWKTPSSYRLVSRRAANVTYSTSIPARYRSVSGLGLFSPHHPTGLRQTRARYATALRDGTHEKSVPTADIRRVGFACTAYTI